MSDITAEQRLALIRSIREENNRNRLSIRNRQNILYGYNYDKCDIEYCENPTGMSNSFRCKPGMRILTAIVLFSVYVILDYTNITFFSLDTTVISTRIMENYDLNAIDFLEEITYTLKDDV